MRNTHNWLLGSCLAGLAAVFILVYQLPSKADIVRRFSDPQAYPRTNVATVTITWTSGGLPVVFTSTRQLDETPEAWRLRAADECAKLKLSFPPDPN